MKKDRIVPTISIVAMLAVVGGLYYLWLEREKELMSRPDSTASTPAPKEEEESKPEPDVRFPVEKADPQPAKPLPPLMESDATLQQSLAELIGKDTLRRFFYLDTLVRRIVVTIDNLPRRKIPQQYVLAQPVPGEFAVSGGKDELYYLKPENSKRYSPYVKFAESVNIKKLVEIYVHFYPLLQEEYKNQAGPKKYFNDRVVVAIDDLLATPEVQVPLKLYRPKVFYQFADVSLESELSAGQKILIRMGRDNAERVKAKLSELRRELTSLQEGGQGVLPKPVPTK